MSIIQKLNCGNVNLKMWHDRSKLDLFTNSNQFQKSYRVVSSIGRIDKK